jgi:prepilin-type N-terminal cleavage/methylation domain-containing protein
MLKRKGFTLVEIMIVVAIIALLAAIAIPNLLRARLNANESAAIAAMQTLVSSATSFRAANPQYPTNLGCLTAVAPPYIDTQLGCANATCLKQGYNFALVGATNSFTATAQPENTGITGVRSFFVDSSGVIRYCTGTTGSPCTATNASDILNN